MINAAATAAMDGTADRPPVERRRRLTAAALAVTNQKVGGAYSPIVIAGAVARRRFRHAEPDRHRHSISAMSSALAASTGNMAAAIVAMTATAVICFQAAEIYDIDVFRGQLRQMTG